MSGLFSSHLFADVVATLQMQHTADEQTGYVWLFVLMATTPYVLLVVIGGGILRARRRQREEEVERILQEQHDWEVARAATETDAAR